MIHCKHYGSAETECGVCYPCVTTRLRAEVERLKAENERLMSDVARYDALGGGGPMAYFNVAASVQRGDESPTADEHRQLQGRLRDAEAENERLARERDEFERKVHVFWGECVETVIQAEERAEKTEAERDAARADRRAYGERVRGLFYEHIKRDDEEEQAFLEALAALEDKP